MSPLPRLLGLAAPLWRWLALAALTGSVALAANVALMAVAPSLISRSALATGFADVAVAVTAVRGLALARATLRYAERYAAHLAALRILTRLRVLVYRAVEPLAPGGLARFRRGDVLARTVADVEALDGLYVRGLLPPLAAGLAAVLAGAIAGWFDPRLGLVLLGFLALAGLAVPLAAGARSRGPAARLARERGELHAVLAEQVGGLADLVAYGREDEARERVRALTAGMARQQRRLASVRGGTAGAGALLAGLAGLALLALAIPLVRGGAIPGVDLALLPLVGFAAFEGVQGLGEALRQVELGGAAAGRTFELLDAPAPVPDPPRPAPLGGSTELELRGVRFRYLPSGPPVLADLSVLLPAGGRLGLAGPSGAGKTTIVGLLLRFWEPEAGAILLGGRDVRSCRAEDVRSRIGVVPQRIHLFNGTLRDNLLVADGWADDDRILDACERAVLGDFVRSLPAGLDTPVGEDGLALSGGERQRLALARVFLRAAPILVMDEATANLDIATERCALRAIDSFAAGRSLLLISHRPAALELAGAVITLPGGRRPAPARATGRGSPPG